MDARWPNGEKVAQPFLITTIKAYLVIDPVTGDEGVTAFQAGNTMMPMICADEARVASMRPIAEAMARDHGVKIKLVEFSVRRDVEVFE